MKYLGSMLILLSAFLQADPVDTWHLLMAQHYTAQKQYREAGGHYEKVSHQADALHYNLGNIYTHEKRYREAIAQYILIHTPQLLHQKFHNIANCLMALGETASAVKFYRNALKFSRHPDTLFNLKLAEALLKEEEKKEKEKDLKESNETLAFRDGSNKIDRFKEDNGTDDLKDAKTPKTIEKKRNSSAAGYTGENGEIDTTVPPEQNSSIKQQNTQLSDSYEAQYWENFFQNLSLKTLLIPLETKRSSHDQNPY